MKLSPFVPKTERRQIVPLSDSSVDRLEERDLFPRRRTLAPGSRRVFWLRAEIEAWLAAQGVDLAALAEAHQAVANTAEMVAAKSSRSA